MKRNIYQIFKHDNSVNVYQTINDPKIVYKEYLYVADNVATIEDMKLARNKLQAMKNRKEWPEFLVRPVVVEKFNKYSFTAGFPFIEGMRLDAYIKEKNIDIHTLANLIKILEERIYEEKDFVFSDLANLGNIMIVPSTNDKIDFKLIDPDDVQFDEYKSTSISTLLAPSFEDYKLAMGMDKCINNERYNKQLDIRSMYALLYCVINGKDFFIPPLFERNGLSEYEQTLKLFNVPENSSLYEKSMKIVSEKPENESIGDSLYELIDNGYELETYGMNSCGYAHRLIKK